MVLHMKWLEHKLVYQSDLVILRSKYWSCLLEQTVDKLSENNQSVYDAELDTDEDNCTATVNEYHILEIFTFRVKTHLSCKPIVALIK